MIRLINRLKNYVMKVPALLFCILLFACNKSNFSQKPSVLSVDTTSQKPPALTGRLVFHSYSCYSCNDSKLFIYDFSANILTRIDVNWGMNNCMNAQFSPDGKEIVFMGTGTGTTNWDVFLWVVNSAALPTNLTAALGASSRDEDPKFSNSGNRIVFKHNGHLAEMDLAGNITRTITWGSGEESMPYYSYNDSLILYAEGSGASSDIYMINTDGTIIKTTASLPGIQEYYPIANDNLTFYYTAWPGLTNLNDQIYRGYYNTNKASDYLPFNHLTDNYSDPYPCGSGYVFLSSTRSDSKGGYDLYIADVNKGNIWSLSSYNYNINSVNDELGSCYTPH